MPNATMYRDRARRLRVMAHDTVPHIHRELLEISEQYERMADQAEMMSRTPTWSTSPAPGTTTSPAPAANSDAAAHHRKDKRVRG